MTLYPSGVQTLCCIFQHWKGEKEHQHLQNDEQTGLLEKNMSIRHLIPLIFPLTPSTRDLLLFAPHFWLCFSYGCSLENLFEH